MAGVKSSLVVYFLVHSAAKFTEIAAHKIAETSDILLALL